mmetsp:Transcript_34239/g.75451  ORF Transcript_34239/g.75451 Transcript_34239/m.75451 type:complete len:915 (+) Transcript_34239:199-2943(+)
MTTRFAVAGGEGDSFCQVTLVMTSTPSSTLQFRMQRTKGRIVYLLHLLRSLASGIFTDTKLPEIVPDGEACHCSVVELQGLLNEFVDSCKGREELLCCDHIREFLDEPAPALLSQPSALFTMGHRLTQLEAAMAQSLASLAGQQEELRALARDLKKGGKKAEKTASFELAPRDVVRTTLRKSGSLTQSVDLSKDSSKEDKGGASSISSGNSHTDSDSSHSPSDTDDDEPKSDEATGAGGDAGSNSLPSSAHLERLLYVTLHPTVEGEVDALVRALQPLTSAVAYRASMQSLLGRAMRSALNCESYESGLHALRCFLPDDALKISAVICRNHSTKWHRLVSDKLAASRGEEEEDMPYSIRNVVISNSKTNIQVHCSADQQEVEISCNARQDVCMLALLEQIAVLVAPGLFKRSLLLIRAWWMYETGTYVGMPVKHYLDDNVICIMVCMVFNLHHSQILSPFHALAHFLAVFASYEGSTQAITLQGIVSFRSPHSSQLTLIEPAASHLVTPALMERYWHLVNLNDGNAPAEATSLLMSTSSDDDIRSPRHLGMHSPPGISVPAQPYLQMSSRFERHSFNLVHPFTHANMAQRVAPRRLLRLQKAFNMGATKITEIMEAGGGPAALDVFFPNLMAKYGQGFTRPDRIPESSPQFSRLLRTPSDVVRIMTVASDRMMSHILYCNFVLESVVSESALLSLCIEILQEKTIQPVGEVGKMLAEITSSPNFSVKLKEKFGGLKKFLEKYSDLFVFAHDHPFNPCVTLRAILLVSNLEDSHHGAHSLLGFMKARKGYSKRITQSSSGGPAENAFPSKAAPLHQPPQQGSGGSYSSHGSQGSGSSHSLDNFMHHPHTGGMGSSMGTEGRRDADAQWRSEFEPHVMAPRADYAPKPIPQGYYSGTPAHTQQRQQYFQGQGQGQG